MHSGLGKTWGHYPRIPEHQNVLGMHSLVTTFCCAGGFYREVRNMPNNSLQITCRGKNFIKYRL
eukprot:c21506_g1_i1 orf=187-378(-)